MNKIDKNTAIKMFNRIYPEFRGIIVAETNDGVIIEADFPDGTFYFKVTENMVSSSYNTLEDAKKD